MAMPKARRGAHNWTGRVETDAPDLPPDREHWMQRAACADVPTQYENFFPETKTQERQAKAICSVCPVAYECLDFSIRTTEQWGIWGGMTFLERCDFTTQYQGHTSPVARRAFVRHLTELNNRKQSTDGRPTNPRVRNRSDAQSR